MRRLLLLALLASCGGGSQDAEITNQAITRVLIHAYVGSVQITTHASGDAVLDADTSESTDLEEFMIFKVTDGVLNVRPIDAALEWEMDIELTLPELIEVEVTARRANVQVEGSYKLLNLTANAGDLDVHLERVGSGTVHSEKGRVAFSTDQATLAGELAVSSATGAVNATLPAAYRGRLFLTTETGTLNLPENKNVRWTGGSGAKTRLGYTGEPDEEGADERAVFKATSTSGTVTLHLDED